MSGGTTAGADQGAGGACLNCGTTRVGDYCHVCGQSENIHRSMGAIGHDLAHGVFHFEGRIWRTLPMLATRPGELTRRYIDGERMRFVSPMALFLFIVFVLFTLLSILGAHLEWEGDRETRTPAAMTAAIVRNDEQIAVLSQRLVQATDRTEIASLNAQLAERRRDSRTMQAAIDTRPGDIPWLRQLRTGWKRLDKGLDKASENPNLILYKLQSNAYKFAWALIPLSLPLLWLLFPFSRRYGMYDHAVFVTYSLCFMLLLVLALSLLAQLPLAGWLYGLGVAAVLIGAPIHMYKQLRGTYACGRFGAALRMILLFVGATVVVTLFALLLVGLGLVG